MATAQNLTGYNITNRDIIFNQAEMPFLEKFMFNNKQEFLANNNFEETNFINENIISANFENTQEKACYKDETNINMILNSVASWVTTEGTNDGFDIPESFVNEQATEIIICYNYAK